MPFRSRAQRRALYAKDPGLAARWEAETPRGKRLPEHVRPKPRRRPRKGA